jgi:hypothetical protein
MDYVQSSPLVEREWLTTEEISSDVQPRDLGARSDQRKRPRKASIDSHNAFGRMGNRLTNDRPSVGRRMLRGFSRFSIAVLIGVAATLVWQSYGDAAREMLIARAPTLAWLLSVTVTKSPVVAATSPAPGQQLESLAFNLDGVRRSVELLAAGQAQMAQSIAALQGVEEDIRQKMSYASSSPSQQAASIPQQKPPQGRAQSPSVAHAPPPVGSLPSPR